MKAFLLLACCGVFTVGAFRYNRPESVNTALIPRKDVVSCGVTGTSGGSGFPAFGFGRNGDLAETISINDNRKTAGSIQNGVLYLNLEAKSGNWFPETEAGKSLPVYAFAETGKPLQLPGPVIRVPEGTIIAVTIHNTIPGDPLVLRGMNTHPANGTDSLVIPFDSTISCRFAAGSAGTYFYWASRGTITTDTGLPFFNDSQLYGAFIVDPPHTDPDPLERIIIIGIWNDTLNGGPGNEELVLNGRTWPFTERLTYEVNQIVNWRIINASNQPHPMHLHGFYFTVKSHGNCNRDIAFRPSQQYLAVTEQLYPHETTAIKWTAEREGNWLFHCHTLVHMLAGSFLRTIPSMTEAEMNDITTHAETQMGGLIMGLSVHPKNESIPSGNSGERQLTLLIKEKKNWYDSLTGYSFVLREGQRTSDTAGSIPGPPIILERGIPVAIKIINQLHENTTIHWHGLEIESYFDGVPGWGNRGKELAPMIMPGDSFTAHILPPRAGTFIYHSHMHNFQLLQGMYGALIVTEPKQKLKKETDKTFLISQGGDNVDAETFFLNGSRSLSPMTLKTGVNYRFRIMNITALGPGLTVSLSLNGIPVKWRALAKDGADLQKSLQVYQDAALQPVTIGETRDFAFNPINPGIYLFEVKNRKQVMISRQINVNSIAPRN